MRLSDGSGRAIHENDTRSRNREVVLTSSDRGLSEALVEPLFMRQTFFAAARQTRDTA